MTKKLANKTIAMLVCDGFEESELAEPRKALLKAGATVHIITPEKNQVKAWRHDKWTKKYKVDVKLEKANAKDYDAIVLPGGVMNPDKLRTNKQAVKFISHFLKSNKLVAAICHGPWTLIETGKIKGRTLTSYPSIKSDLKNAGVRWKNKKVVIDKNLITSRNPNDIPAFNAAIIKELT